MTRQFILGINACMSVARSVFSPEKGTTFTSRETVASHARHPVLAPNHFTLRYSLVDEGWYQLTTVLKEFKLHSFH